MKIIYAGLISNEFEIKIDAFSRLISYYEIKNGNSDNSIVNLKLSRRRAIKKEKRPILFLDSGAFSALSRNDPINIDEYIDYIHQNLDVYDTYSVLDVIGSASKTNENLKIMESSGLSPLPVFHYGSNIKYLHKLLDNYECIALGGMVPISTKKLIPWLDHIWSNYLTDKSGSPIAKIHGFGMTTLSLLKRYPWHSVDSIRPVICGGLGKVFIPKTKNDQYNYLSDFYEITISDRPAVDGKEKSTKEFKALPFSLKNHIKKYMKHTGHVMGNSTFTRVSEKYRLRPEQRKIGLSTRDDGSFMIEHKWKNGISNDSIQRRVLNVKFFNEVEKAINKTEQKLNLSNEAVAKENCKMFSNII